MKCKVCGKRFKLRAEDKYDVRKSASFGDVLSGKATSTVYECFDCSHCGCQNIVNVREKEISKVKEKKVGENNDTE